MKKEELEKLKEFLNTNAPNDIFDDAEQVLALMLFCGNLIESYERALNVIVDLTCDENYISGNKAHERAHKFLRSIE